MGAKFVNLECRNGSSIKLESPIKFLKKKKVSWASEERDAERSISMALQFGLFSILNFFHLPPKQKE